MEKRTREKMHRMDYGILLMVTLLCAFGLVMVFSASYYYAQNHAGANYDGYFYLKKQATYMLISYPIMILLSFFDYRQLEKFKVLGFLISVGLLVAVLLFGEELNGAKRWIVIAGQSIQPSEIAKFGMMLYMCAFMAKKQAVMHEFKRGMLPMLLIIGVICGLIMLQPNMSMAVIIGLMGYALLFAGGADVKQMLLLGVVLVALFILFAVIEPYRFKRLTTFTDPWGDGKNGLGSGYQLIQSFYALGSGGLFGLGLRGARLCGRRGRHVRLWLYHLSRHPRSASLPRPVRQSARGRYHDRFRAAGVRQYRRCDRLHAHNGAGAAVHQRGRHLAADLHGGDGRAAEHLALYGREAASGRCKEPAAHGLPSRSAASPANIGALAATADPLPKIVVTFDRFHA